MKMIAMMHTQIHPRLAELSTPQQMINSSISNNTHITTHIHKQTHQPAAETKTKQEPTNIQLKYEILIQG